MKIAPLGTVLMAYSTKLFGTVTNEILNSITTVLLEGGAFTAPFLPDSAPERAKDHARVAQNVWAKVMEKTPDVLTYQRYIHDGIVDATPDVINSLLNLEFPSKIEALNWLKATTQLTHLRGSFFSEGFKGDVKINIARWQNDELCATEMNSSKQEAWQQVLYNNYAKLKLVDSVPYPPFYFNIDDQQDRSVIIHGVVSPYLDSRIDFLAPVKNANLNVYYLTNPRGIFNYEHLADILAKTWFDDATLSPTIQTVLNKAEHKDCWLGNIAAAKLDILIALGRDTWPEGRGAWYGANKTDGNIYQIAVEAEGNKRQSLKDWPVIEDLIHFLLEKKKVANPGQFDNVSIKMVLTRVEGRVANTKDTLEYLRSAYPEALQHGAVFISDNLSHNILKQDLEAVNVLGREVVLATVGASSDVLDPKQARDALAKIIFEHFTDVKCQLNAQDTTDNKVLGITSVSGTLYAVPKKPIDSTDASVDTHNQFKK